MEAITVEHLTFSYPQAEKNAVEEVSFSVDRGEFVALCGATGSGKSTLMRLLKRELIPKGSLTGAVLLGGVPMEELSAADSARKIGFVMQKPEQQLVCDKVWHELAFGLENLRLPREVIARRVAEMASYFGIEEWYDKEVSSLSGGQKQLLNLASVMVMQPEVLLLDEPTAQLDPIAAADFLATVKKLNRELSLTVIIAEHRLEEVVPICDRLMVLEAGSLTRNGTPKAVVASLRESPELLRGMPAAARLYHALGETGECPLTVREGRDMIERSYRNDLKQLPPATEASAKKAPALEFRSVCFRYDRLLPDVLRELNLTVEENEIFCILGGNGSGKSTTLGVAAGILKAYAGTVRIFGKKPKDYPNGSLYRECLSMLPQDVQTVFLRNTVREELEDAGGSAEEIPFDISRLLNRHPYDLSGGEQQLAALAKVLCQKPKILLLDEPTKGLDAVTKETVASLLKELKKSGVTIVAVTHDVEFASQVADRCALFFRGNVVSTAEPRPFFSENHFYTTAVNRMTRGYFDGAITVEDAAELCRKNQKKGASDDAPHQK